MFGSSRSRGRSTSRVLVPGALSVAVVNALLAFALASRDERVPQTGEVSGAEPPEPVASSPDDSPSGLADGEPEPALAAPCRHGSAQSEGDDAGAQPALFSSEVMHDIAERLSLSSSSEHLHVAALLDRDPASRVQRIELAVSRNPDHALLLWGAVHICADAIDTTDCRLRDWEQRLLAIDGQNSESWVRVAANRYQAGDSAAALAAMRHAATAAESRAYWTETIEMIERGLAAGSDYTFPERVSVAFGLAASSLPDYGDYLTMCREQSAENVEWAYVCLAYGELVEQQGKTEMGVSIALAIQKVAFEALGDEEKLGAVAARQQRRRNARESSVGSTEHLLLSEPAALRDYLAAIRIHGEHGARVRLAAETSRWLARQPEANCEE